MSRKRTGCEDCGELSFGTRCKSCHKTNVKKTSNKIEIACKVCGGKREVYSSHAKQKYCSKKCAGTARGKKTKMNCEVCEKEMGVVHSKIENGGGRFCSTKCMGIAKIKEKTVITCETCGKKKKIHSSIIKNGGGKYCSMGCYSTARKNKAKGNKIKITCNVCGKIKEVTPSRAKNGRAKYCSDGCKHIAYSKKIKIACEICGETKEFKPSDIENGGGKYCSNDCRVKALITKVKIICEVCREEFWASPSDIKRGRKRCSNKCMGIAQIKDRIKRTCGTCRKKIERRPLEIKDGRDTYCSSECAGIANTGENNPNWQGGKSFDPYPKTWTSRLRKEIRARDNNRCMRCGRAREEFKQALSVHHIDANKDNCNYNNLISLCDHIEG